MAAVELGEELGGEASDLLLGGFGVGVLRLFEADVSARGEDEVVVADLFERCCFAESGHVLIVLVRVARAPRVVGAGDAFDVGLGELALRTGDHLTHVASIDEEHLTVAVAVAVTVPVLREEPQSRRNPCVEEELVG